MKVVEQRPPVAPGGSGEDGKKDPEEQAEQPASSPPPQTARRQNAPVESRGFDLDFGGGAIDPVSGSIAAGLAGLAAAAWRRKRSS